MTDFSTFLATLAQSSAAIVAIIGGFLVSRLVALSSEREGIKRQLTAATHRRDQHKDEYDQTHGYRFERSVAQLEDWIEDKLIESAVQGDQLDLDELVLENIPRGSNLEELLPEAKNLASRISDAVTEIRSYIRVGDTRAVDLSNLKERGLTVPADAEDTYQTIVYEVKKDLPDRIRPFGVPDFSGVAMSIQPAWQREVDMRRLDESIRDEQHAATLLYSDRKEVDRLQSDLRDFAQPVGVQSAVVILSLFSVLGILLPLLVMIFGVTRPPAWLTYGLLGAFAAGLASVLGYIVWYLQLRT